ncbi:hypothetical protein OHB49_02740 [Streptomyces sp. NBC_01717]|nr:hypothetical protein [Streptomyces sp. NBC_01717]
MVRVSPDADTALPRLFRRRQRDGAYRKAFEPAVTWIGIARGAP